MAARKKHDSRCALSADPMPVNGECWCDLWDSLNLLVHDPLCRKYGQKDKPEDVIWCCDMCDADDCQCDLIAKARDEERWATVESAVYVASQSGAVPELVELLSRLYEAPEVQMDDEVRREAARELTRMAQEDGLIP